MKNSCASPIGTSAPSGQTAATSSDATVCPDGALVPMGDAQEFFMLADFIDGHEYADDLLRLRAGGAMGELDGARADALCDYLVEIHRLRRPEPGLYARRAVAKDRPRTRARR